MRMVGIPLDSAVSTAIIIVCAIAWTVMLANQEEKAALEAGPRVPLPDRGHRATPRLYGVRWLVNTLPVALLGLAVWNLPARITMALLSIYALLLFWRGLAFWVTREPPPRSPCVPYNIGDTYVGGCSDMMYSGHTSLMLLSTLFLLYYSPNPVLGWIAAGVTGLGMYLILATRHHYTADEVIAVGMCSLAFAALRPRAQS